MQLYKRKGQCRWFLRRQAECTKVYPEVVSCSLVGDTTVKSQQKKKESQLKPVSLKFPLLTTRQLRVLLIMTPRSWHRARYSIYYSSYVPTESSQSLPPYQSITILTPHVKVFTPQCKRTSTLTMASVVYSRHVSTVPVQVMLRMAVTVSHTRPECTFNRD